MILCENKRILRKKGSEKLEANKRNACETHLCSLRFALKRKKIEAKPVHPISTTPVANNSNNIRMMRPKSELEGKNVSIS